MKQENDYLNSKLESSKQTLIALKEWLSISESQMCSTEVLSEQLPKINSLLESSMNDISEHFNKITMNSSDIEKEIRYIDQAIDIIKIGKKEIEITDHLSALAAKTSDANTAEALRNLSQEIQKQEKDLHNELKKATDNIKENSNEISKIVVGMQFQDRVSQNILITINIMKTIVEYLEKEISKSLPNLQKDERRKLLDKEFAKEILTQFRLGELQVSFVNHLIEHGYIKDAEEIGFHLEDHKKNDDEDDIELF
ncbi:MAG: hypothetical protein COV35_00285 [Alphaproteobacteria bacterium CG11_big_fil_rev_8_21_14_0_20_39_49]|nr:MAG: hypothetical protein COV35_00285 [Alphaproteobacteria bacterium CG11_big_fil_rev_8_21_14_0_20_39_49]